MAFQTHADTVYLKNGEFKKGVVVEGYADRIVFSTVDGEKMIMKKNIERIKYDDPEMNLMSLGDAAFDKGWYKLAYRYYALAQEMNPELDMAGKRRDHAGLLAYKEKEMTKRELVEKRAMLESRKAPAYKKIDPEETLEKELGIMLRRTESGNFKLEAMTIKSPFRKAGFKIGDHIAGVWSRLASYLTLKEMSQLLLAQDQHIIKLTLERTLKLQRKAGSALGIKFVMRWGGMMVESVVPGSAADKAGLEEDDILVSVDGKSIRYTKMKDVLKLLNKEGKREITIQRPVTVFKTG